MPRAINEKGRFEVQVERLEDGELEVYGDPSLSDEADDYISRHQNSIFCDAPTKPGSYIAEGEWAYYSHPGDWYNPPEEDTTVSVTSYREVEPCSH